MSVFILGDMTEGCLGNQRLERPLAAWTGTVGSVLQKGYELRSGLSTVINPTGHLTFKIRLGHKGLSLGQQLLL